MRTTQSVRYSLTQLLTHSPNHLLTHSPNQLIQLKLGIKYRSTYSKAQFVAQLAHMCPEYDVVLAQCAMYLHRIRYLKQAEQIFIGALLNNSLCVDALRGYAHLLIDKGTHSPNHLLTHSLT
jgi:hypothetical protein